MMKFCLFIFYFLLISLFFRPGLSFGEQVIEIDQTAPAIIYSQKTDSIEEGKPFEISVQVTDNVKVSRVTLFYRRNGENHFQSVNMINTDHDRYSFLIPGKQIFGATFEHYIVAEDGAGNRTMKGFSATPLVLNIIAAAPGRAPLKPDSGFNTAPIKNRPFLMNSTILFNSTEFFIGEAIFRLSEQGQQIQIPALTYGFEAQYRYRTDKALGLGINLSQTESIEISSVVYQNLSGTLFESLNSFSIYLGQRFLYPKGSLLLAVDYLHTQLSDRNLLNTAGNRITKFPDESESFLGVVLGFDFHYPITDHIRIGVDPRVHFFTSGRFNHLVFPGAIWYEF
ncbi:MAG: hypothetical protein HY036_01065 [Nitrospirae bacterium]|nr:hypothetical protein [Nitrospirota bacterium]